MLIHEHSDAVHLYVPAAYVPEILNDILGERDDTTSTAPISTPHPPANGDALKYTVLIRVIDLKREMKTEIVTRMSFRQTSAFENRGAEYRKGGFHGVRRRTYF